LADATIDLVFTAIANAYATLLYWLNFALDPDIDTNLTDNSGGTASSATVPVITAVTKSFTAYTDVATSSAPKAAFDTECPKIANNFADLALKINDLIRYQDLGITPLTDSSGGTADTTLQVISSSLSAVSGAGSTSLSKTSCDAVFTIFANTLATLTSKVNALSAFYGFVPLTDSSTGTVSTTNTLAAVGTSGAGVDNSATAVGVLNTAVNTALGVIKDNMATLAARLTALDDIGSSRPLKVIATV
jgi:hypothetical protein